MKKIALFCSLVGISLSQSVSALEMDWSGQFWSELNWVYNYSMDGSSEGAHVDPIRQAAGGYYIPGGGTDSTTFQTLFLRLRPNLIINDSFSVKSEWWIGDPIFGLFGSSVPYTADQRQYSSTQSRGSTITAQRVWGEFVTDLGTFQVGRVPLHWGLGGIWNSGDSLWSRYMSTGDAIRWIAKFGAFSFIPSFILPSAGNTIGGSCLINPSTGICTPGIGLGGVTDYSLILKYENSEDALEGGVHLIKRISGSNQDPTSGLLTSPGIAGGMNYITYDFYAKKQLDQLVLGVEIPVVTGSIAGVPYKGLAIIGEANWKPSDSLDLGWKWGHVSGQTALSGPQLDTYRALYLNPNYRVGMILFQYQLANFAGPQTLNASILNPSQLQSPYNNPIVDAQYIAFAPVIRPWDKWSFRPAILYARAPQTAVAGEYFFNYWTRSVSSHPAVKNQGSSLGWELDFGITFQWDEYCQFSWDQGLFFPGSFYAFSNTTQNNATSPVFASSLRVGVNF